MKNISRLLFAGAWFTVLILNALITSAQSGTAPRSAKEGARYDEQRIAGNIEDLRDILFFSQKAMDRAGNTRTKEIAQNMFTDYTTILYSFEQLATAGAGSSGNNTPKGFGVFKETSELNGKLSLLSGLEFDTVWVSNLVAMQQFKYDELTQAKEIITNSQLKTSVTEAIPVYRRYISQLKSLQKSLTRMMQQEKKEAARKPKKRV